ncbi:MAG: ACP S-malonyltransferase [Candidatus Omnitrophica bacterium]|nr:ACP S-malonyltransferase [Candidatus Omnitrophota bacterium]
MIRKKYGLLFPGQGSQYVGMGKDLYEREAAARWVFDKAGSLLGMDIKKLCFLGPEDELMSTKNSQPAIFTTCMAALNVLAEKVKGSPVGKEERDLFSSDDIVNMASIALGLSLGEPIALVASGAISFEDGLFFVKERGRLMDEASRKEEGQMATILGLELSKIEEICLGLGCQVANLNCPGQVVISGPSSVVELAADLARNAGAKRAIVLKVSGAFHSALMKPAKHELKKVLSNIKINEPAVDFISNLDALVTKDPEKIRTNLSDQLDNRTLWEASVTAAVSLGITDFLEVGPGKVLKGLAKKIDPKLNVTNIETVQDIENFLGQMASSQVA